MNVEILFLPSMWQNLEEYLLQNDLEQGALCLAEPVVRPDSVRLLVREVIPVPQESLLAQSGGYLETDPIFFAPVIKKARLDRYSVIVCHSHPFSKGLVNFSSIDDRGESQLIPKIEARVPEVPHAALVLGRGAAAGRVHTRDGKPPQAAKVRIIGRYLRTVEAHGRKTRGEENSRYHRQTLFWGNEVQDRLSRLRVVVVGHGGTGSHVVQQLVHLGVGHIVVVDPDAVEYSNLNRLVGAQLDDVRQQVAKVDVAARTAANLGRRNSIVPLRRSILERSVALDLVNADVLFGCTDNMESRRLLNRLSFQYYIPLIDVGIDLEVDDRGIFRTGAGRFTLVLPEGGPCLHSAQVLRNEDASRGYVEGMDDPNPAVVSFNGLVSSLGVSVLLGLIGAYPNELAHQQFYRLVTGRLIHEPLQVACSSCLAVLGVGDSRALPWKVDSSSAA